MPAPTINLTTTGADPKATTLEGLQSEVNGALSDLWDAAVIAQADAETLALAEDALAARDDAEDAAAAAEAARDAAALYDGPWFDTVAALLADTTLSYGSGASGVTAGDYVRTRAEGFAYQVAASGATDHHVATAGGVKLYVVPLWLGSNGGIHNPIAWGADDNGATDVSAILDKVFAQGGTVFLPPGSIFWGNGQTITLAQSVRVLGNGAEMRDVIFAGQGAAAVDCADFEDVTFTTALTPNPAVLPPYAFNPRNIDRVSLRRCIFDGVMAYIATDDEAIRYGLHVDSCQFLMDGTGWAWETLQLDPLTIAGYRHVLVENCIFNVTNVNRVMKVTAGLTVPLTPVGNPVPTMNVRGITFRKNTFLGQCDLIGGNPGGKQVIDCFVGTTESTFEDNYFACTGFNNCIENKTGYAYSEAGIVTAHKIINNRFYLDFCAIFFQGSYGLSTFTPNSRDTLLLSGNTYRISTIAGGTMSIRFMHLLTLDGEDASMAAAVANKSHLELSSCEEIRLNGVSLDGGTIVIGNATGNSQGQSFTAPVRRVLARGVAIKNWGDAQTVSTAGLMIRDCTGLSSVIIEGCVSETPFDNANMLAAFWLRACGTVPDVIVRGNVASHSANAAKELIRSTDSTITGRFVEEGNSWIPAMKNLANSATPSVRPSSSGSALTNGGALFQTGGGTAITDLLDGYIGQVITIYANQNCTIINGTPIRLNGGADFAMNLYDTLTLLKLDAARWVELSRSVN